MELNKRPRPSRGFIDLFTITIKSDGRLQCVFVFTVCNMGKKTKLSRFPKN